MSKAKKKEMRQQAACEGKYERICRDRQERDELDMLNRKVRERVDRMQQEMLEQQAKAAYERMMQEKKLKALTDLVLLVIVGLIVSLGVITLANMGAMAWWLSLPLAISMLVVCSFRSGWLWHEIKK